MLVKFVTKENPTIIIQKEYSDILPLLEMIRQKSAINIFLDENGDQHINGRLYDYEYTISKEKAEIIQESLLVIIDC